MISCLEINFWKGFESVTEFFLLCNKEHACMGMFASLGILILACILCVKFDDCCSNKHSFFSKFDC